MGHRREDLTSCPVLFRPAGAYLIIYRSYRSERRPIKIVAVTQGSRHIPAFLSRRIRPLTSAHGSRPILTDQIFRNSSVPIPACFRIARSVPSGISPG